MAHRAPIGEAREEILRLIARLNGGAAPGTQATSDRAGASLAGRTEPKQEPSSGPGVAARGDQRPGDWSDRVADRRQALDEVKALRRQLEAGRGDSRLADRVRTLESRVARLEERPAAGGPVLVEPPSRGSRSMRPSLPPPARVPESSPYAVEGQLIGQLLADLLQLISSNAMTGVFAVASKGIENRLYFEEGQIVHADGPGLSGEDAVFATLGFEEGRYTFLETTDLPAERTISSNTQFLILEALRKIDEAGA